MDRICYLDSYVMKQIGMVSKGPKGLVIALNEIIAALNSLQLQQGKGISITSTGKGWIVSKS